MGRPGLTKHRKFKRLAHALEPVLPGMGELLARGCLETIWESAYETGNDYVGTAEDVESLAGWQGKRGLLCGAMEAAGFLDPLDEDAARYRVHDLYDHAPEYVRKRMDREAARRERGVTLAELRAAAAREKWRKRAQAAANGSQLQERQPDLQPDAPVVQTAVTCSNVNSMVAPTSVQTAANGTTPAPAPAPIDPEEALSPPGQSDLPLGQLPGQASPTSKPPKQPRKQQDVPPLPFKVEEALAAVATESAGRFVSPKLIKQGHMIQLVRAIRAYPDIAAWRIFGAWLAAGGEGYRATLDIGFVASKLTDLAETAKAWANAGRGPVNGRSTNQKARGVAPPAHFPKSGIEE